MYWGDGRFFDCFFVVLCNGGGIVGSEATFTCQKNADLLSGKPIGFFKGSFRSFGCFLLYFCNGGGGMGARGQGLMVKG